MVCGSLFGRQSNMNNLTPNDLLEKISALSEEYYDMCDEMGQIAERKAYAWLEIKNNQYSKEELKVFGETGAAKKPLTNAEVDKIWDSSADGRRENYLKWYIRGLSAKRSTLILQLKADTGTL